MRSHRLTGPPAVALAVLSRAIVDYLCHPQQYWQADAQRWIFDLTEDTKPYFFTFTNCCALVGCDPAKLRQRLSGLQHTLAQGPPVRGHELLTRLTVDKPCLPNRKHTRREVHANGDHQAGV
jgi:hypothetical protein